MLTATTAPVKSVTALGLELPGSRVEFPAEKGLEFAYCFSQAVQVEF